MFSLLSKRAYRNLQSVKSHFPLGRNEVVDTRRVQSLQLLSHNFSTHRDFGANEKQFIRTMSPKGSNLSFFPYSHDLNPGIRVVPEVINAVAAETIWNESHNHIIPKYGLKGEFDKKDSILIDGKKALNTNMNTIRITGRFESSKQILAPWGYGDAFNKDKLPKSILDLVQKIQNLPNFRFGKCRDVTINYRQDGFFKLDPHIDPSEDGEDVVIISIGPSPTVITFTPPVLGLQEIPQTSLQALAAKRRRTSPADISLLSWSDADLDVLSLPRSGVVFSGAARWKWRHATRTGVAASASKDSTETINCDWFGSTSQLLPRKPGSRLSIVVAFGKI